jgi:tripartite ATP-independent transporter DctM subunit
MTSVNIVDGAGACTQADDDADDAARPMVPVPIWLRWIDDAAIVILNVTLLAQVLIVFASTILRSFVSSNALMGVAETAHPFLITIAFLGGAVSYSRGQFIVISLLLDRVSPVVRDVLRGVAESLVVLISIPFALYSLRLLAINYEETTLLLGISYAWMTLPITLGAALFTIHAVNGLLKLPIGAIAAAAVMVVAATLVFFVTKDVIGATSWLLYSVLAGSFIVLLLLAVPIGFILAITGTMCVLAAGSADMTSAVMSAQRGSSGFILLALPFFILAGFIMDRADIGGRIVDLVASLIGHVRGGLLQVLVIGCYLGSCVSGSKAADMAMIGIPMGERLKRQGYPAHERAAVLAAAAAMAESVPPSIALILIGSATGISTGALFVAGMLPAATLAICLMILIRVRASVFNWAPTPRASVSEVGIAARRAILPLLMPVILIGGIIFGWGTPTEVSTFAVVYGIALGVVYRRFTLATLWQTLTSATMLNGMVFFTVSAATIFSWALTLEGVTNTLAALASGFGSTGFLLMVILITVIVAAILDSFVTIIILAPLFLPVAQKLSVEPLQFGIVMAEAFGIGCILPPIGIALYVACKISGARVEATSRVMVWYLGMLILGLMFVVMFPQITTILPSLIGMKG